MTESLHQILTGATAGDAITDHALLIRGWLRQLGFASEIYVQHIHPGIADEVRPLSAFRTSRADNFVIYHHSIGSEAADFLLAQDVKLILIHHNVTPPQFFAHINPAWVQMTTLGQKQFVAMQPKTILGLADSAYNELELQEAGFTNTAVLPITLNEKELDLPSNETLAAELEGKRPYLLFVGRLSPNKKQEDLVKLLHYYRRIQPEARLFLVGDRWDVKYDLWVEQLAADLGLSEAVTLTGKVSQQDMITYYRQAALYVSMSEHEGFGKPFIESMYFDLPILAYSSTSVPYTLSDAGAQFRQKDYERLAELTDILITDKELRKRIIAKQRRRVKAFQETVVRQIFISWLIKLQLIAP
ncbi:MAG: glycosyltransferase [Chloroflexi bacterium]|nr:glycosyltransferase [Chloroflexota bacterium]